MRDTGGDCRPHTKTGHEIWSIAGGKGGTGKTFLTASLGLVVSKKRETVLIDGDFGAPNLHTHLGICRTKRNLQDFLWQKTRTLAQVKTSTGFPHLELIPGSTSGICTANLLYAHKQKLIRHIRILNGGYSIIDLGAGSHFDTLDLFAVSDRGILVTTPDPASIETLYQFLRSVSARIIRFTVREFQLVNLIKRASKIRASRSISPSDLVAWVAKEDREAGETLREALSFFRFHLVVNKTRNYSDSMVGPSIVSIVRTYLGLEVAYLGSIPHDRRIVDSLKEFRPFVLEYPRSSVTRAIQSIAEGLMDSEPNAQKATS